VRPALDHGHRYTTSVVHLGNTVQTDSDTSDSDLKPCK